MSGVSRRVPAASWIALVLVLLVLGVGALSGLGAADASGDAPTDGIEIDDHGGADAAALSAPALGTVGIDTMDEADTANSSANGSESDTAGPSVTLDEPETNVSGDQNLTAYIAESTDVAGYAVTVHVGGEHDAVLPIDGTDQPEAFEDLNAREYDTTELPDGEHALYVEVTDENGTTAADEVDITVDNGEAVTVADAYLPGRLNGYHVPVDRTFNVTDVFQYDGSHGLEYYVGEWEGEGEGEDPATGDELEIDPADYADEDVVDLHAVDRGGEDEPGESVSLTVEVDRLTVGHFEVTDDGEQTTDNPSDINVRSNRDDLDGLNVTIEPTDTYGEGSALLESIGSDPGDGSVELTREDFRKTGEAADGEHIYAAEVPETLREGHFTATLECATDGSQTITPELATEGGFDVDDAEPAALGAHVVDGDSDELTVHVVFTEPIDAGALDAEDVSVEGLDDETIRSVDPLGDAETDVVELTVDVEFQTADMPNVSFDENSVVEVHDADGQTSNADATTATIYTSAQAFDAGLTPMSIPVESGSVDVEDAEIAGDIETIWAYDGDGEWSSYSPDADENSLTSFEGGTGYVVRANGTGAIALNAENVVGNDDVHAPQSQPIEEGWNLIGHYQEGSQSVEQALTYLHGSDATYDVERAYSGEQVTELDPEEAYWLYSSGEGSHAPVNYDGAVSDQPVVANVELHEIGDGENGELHQSEPVDVHATVQDPDLVDSVTVDAPALGIENEKLHGDSADETSEYVTDELAIDFGDVEPNETYRIEVTATDAGGNSGSEAIDSIPVEANEPYAAVGIGDGSSVPPIETGDVTNREAVLSVADVEDSALKTAELTIERTNNGTEYYDDERDAWTDAATSVDITDNVYDQEASDWRLMDFDISDFEDDTYDVILDVEDRAGNIDSDNVSFERDTTAPDVDLQTVDHDGDAIADGEEITVTAAASDETLAEDTIELDASAIGAGESVTMTSGDDDEYTTTVTADLDSENGTAAFEVSAEDGAGNDASDAGEAAYDGTVPEIESYGITNDDPTNTRDVEVSFESSEELETIEATVEDGEDGGTLSGVGEKGDFTEADGTYTATYEGSTDGDYTITLDEAADAAGNDGAIGDSDSVLVDTNSIDVTIDSPNDGNAVQSQDTIEGGASDDTEIASVELDIATDDDRTWNGTEFTDEQTTVTANYDEEAETWSYDSSGFDSRGEYDVTVTAMDTAGNIDEDSVAYTVDPNDPGFDYSTIIDDEDQNALVTDGDSVTIMAEPFDDETSIDHVEANASGIGAGPSVELTPNAGPQYDATVEVGEVESGLDASDATIEITAYDEAGNDASVTTDAVVVDNSDPTAEIHTPSNDVSNADTIEFTAEDDVTGVDSADLTIQQARDDGEYLNSSGEFQSAETSLDVADESGTFDISALEDDEYVVTLAVEDMAGLTNSTERTFDRDTGIGEASINTDGPVPVQPGNSVTLNVDANDSNLDHAELVVNDSIDHVVDAPVVIEDGGEGLERDVEINESASSGTYNGTLHVVDDAGNEELILVEDIVQVDGTAPEITENHPTDGETGVSRARLPLTVTITDTESGVDEDSISVTAAVDEINGMDYYEDDGVESEEIEYNSDTGELTVDPSPNWVTSSPIEVSIDVEDEAGNSIETFEINFHIASAVNF